MTTEENFAYTGTHDHSKATVAIIVSKWNSDITNALYDGAVQTLSAAGVTADSITRYDVPGSYELPMGAQIALSKQPKVTGVICLGCVIQGETKHFDFINQAVASGIMQVGLISRKPVIFGVLTPNDQQQAIDRAGGRLGNKGAEAAVALLEMIELQEGNHGRGKIGF